MTRCSMSSISLQAESSSIYFNDCQLVKETLEMVQVIWFMIHTSYLVGYFENETDVFRESADGDIEQADICLQIGIYQTHRDR